MNAFAFTTYKEFLHGYIEEHKQKGLVSQMADACGCDRTYLSQVLNGKAELTPDHLINFTDSIGLSEVESRYLLLVLLRDRASSLSARKSLDAKIEKLKHEVQVLSQKIVKQENPSEIREEQRTLYYSSWLYGAIHILVSIPAYQTVPALAAKLQIAPVLVMKILKDLTDMRVVTKEKDRYLHAGSDVYIPHDKPQIHFHHFNWRMRAVERTMVKEDIHYTNVFSISKDDIEKLRQQILDLISEQRKAVRESGTEVAYAFCCDFFGL